MSTTHNHETASNLTIEELQSATILVTRTEAAEAAPALRRKGYGTMADAILNAGGDAARGNVWRRFLITGKLMEENQARLDAAPETCVENGVACVRHIRENLDEMRKDNTIWETRMVLSTCGSDVTVLITRDANQVCVGLHIETLSGDTTEAAHRIHTLVRKLPAVTKFGPVVNPVGAGPKEIRAHISRTLLQGPSALTEDFIREIGNLMGRLGQDGLALVLFNIANDKARHSYRHWLFEARKALAEVA